MGALKSSPWRIRLTDGVEFTCQHWCPRLAEAEQVWPYTSMVKGPAGMRENLLRNEIANGHAAASRILECPTCITAVLDGPPEAPTGCGPVFVKADQEALHAVLGTEVSETAVSGTQS